MAIDFATVIPKIDGYLARGLSHGVGQRDGQMCVEAAICAALDLPHGDDPGCVHAAVRRFKIRLNDSRWSSPQARANGLRNLAIAQLGTKDSGFDGLRFTTDVAVGVINRIISELPGVPDAVRVACREAKTLDTAREAAKKARAAAADAAAAAAYAAADAAYADSDAAYAADAADAAAAADAAYADSDAAAAADNVLLIAAEIGLQALRNQGVEKVPGLAWL